MAKGGSSKKGGAKSEQADDAAKWSMEALPEALRDAGKRAAELAQNPYARSLLAAGLVAAAAALAANKNVREATRKNLKAATDAAEVGAENVGKVGIAIVNAATEAVQRMMGVAGEAEPAPKRGGGAKSGKAKSGSSAKSVRSSTAKKAPAKAATARKAPAKAATAKPAASKATASKPATKRAPAKAPATRARKSPAAKPPGSSNAD